jgi:Ca-activated chloride channel family protein
VDYEDFNTEEYDAIEESGFASVSKSPLSTFGADVDTASYSNVRRMINEGYRPENIPDGAVRTEEMVNYFSYSYNGPENGEPFGVNATIADCPWNEEHLLLHLGLQTEELDFSQAGDSNIVFLIDISGSMDSPNKLPLLQQAFGLLVNELGQKDRVSIVTYASGNAIVMDGVSGDNKQKIMDELNGLQAGGGTNGGSALEMAYQVAEKNFIENGNNRVILASDGDWNVGITSQSEMSDLIKEKKESGIYLSVLGFGMGNYSDSRMQTLADDGNGNYAYIDSLREAKKVLVEELGANMVTVADDVKLQIEFNPVYVSEYRLIGYENRRLNTEDFEDDTKDAGEVGAGHSVTVLYELVPAGEETEESDLKYQTASLTEDALNSNEWLTLAIRSKDPGEADSKLLEYPIGADCLSDGSDDDFRFSAAVAEFSMLLKDSEYKGDASYEHVLETLEDIQLGDEYREEFRDLVKTVANS